MPRRRSPKRPEKLTHVARAVDRPSDVGILASYIAFPETFVSQAALEKFDGAGEGKYQIGLGQGAPRPRSLQADALAAAAAEKMAFCGPREDIHSLMMTAVSELLSRYGLSPADIGRLEVGTESLVDKSKSAKTTLMQLFSNNSAMEGVTSMNACYGGTAALFHTLDWVESSAWDGRYGLVVCGDVAVYAPGPARPTGGAGVVAMLVGPNAPLVVESKLRSTHMENAWDFYKGDLMSEYPQVDGKLSNSCYIRAIDKCFHRYADKFERTSGKAFNLADAQHAVFHQPYTKLVQKSYARMAFNEALREPAGAYKALAPFAHLADTEASYVDKDLEKACLAATKADFASKVYPSTFAGRNLGNSYTGSLYAGLISLIASQSLKRDDRALMFSYGSGLAASLYSLRVAGSVEEQRIACDLHARLAARVEATPEAFSKAREMRQMTYGRCDYAPQPHPAETLAPGSYFLSRVDHNYRREYARVPPAVARAVQKPAAPVEQAVRQAVHMAGRALRR